ncbi:O-antigen ligase family protein [Leptolyngbya ohadii]|uniref:O-antigen ligase family protein n=1 Tax=Leptolyngbya ohadii TaxID=1962290 RepID=UPI000B5A1C5A|nr:O-antigen ligase family protein [Leptolyngbya ohadii]
MITSQQQGKELLYYQGLLAVGVIFFFFTFLDSYIAVQQIIVSPVGWMLPYFALTVPLFLLGKLKFPSAGILYWCAGYILLAVISYAWFPASTPALRALIDRCFSAVFLLVTACLLADSQVQQWARFALVGATMLGVLNNCYQLLDPFAFLGLVDNRVSGLYMDPNDCAYALSLGMVLTVGIFPKKIRIPWILMVGLGVMITLSRGGMLAWVAAVLLLCLTRILPYRQAGLWILGVSTLVLVLVFSGEGDRFTTLSLVNEQMFERGSDIISGNTLFDPSALERKGILEKAWQMFLERPIFGYGIGSTSDYSITGFTVSTHNMFLLHAAEYGIVGFLILPLIIYASTRWATGETRKIAAVFILVILISSLFSHTVLDLRSYLIGFALMAAMSATHQAHFDPALQIRNGRGNP